MPPSAAVRGFLVEHNPNEGFLCSLTDAPAASKTRRLSVALV